MFRLHVLRVSVVLLLVVPPLRAADSLQFRRGDANGDGSTSISDSVYTLLYLFEGSAAPCEKALDVNDDGRVDLSDAVRSLLYLYAADSRPPAPFPGCGMDPTPDALSCAAFAVCPGGGSVDPAPSSGLDDPSSDDADSHVSLADRQGSRRWSYAYGEGRSSLVEDATRCAAMIDPAHKNGREVLELALEKVGGFATLRASDAQEYPGLWYPRFLKDTSEKEHLALIEKLHAIKEVRFASPLLIYGQAVAIPQPEIMLTIDADAQEEDIQELLSQPDLRLIREFPSIDATLQLAFDGSPAECFARCDELNELDAVYVAEPNLIWDLPKLATPNDPLYSDQWDLNNTGQTGGTAGADMRAQTAWDMTTGSASIVIAICDEGVDVDHPDLAANMVAGHDSVTADSNPPSVPGDAGGNDAHGTCCAGIAAAVGNNGIGIAGINWNAKIMPVRIGFGNYWTATSWIVDAITWAADNGADVQSHSWGGGSASTSIEGAFIYATTNARGGLGSACFCASGNENSSVSYPAKYDSTVAVGATSPCDERKSPSSCDGETWWGSNYGPELDLCAPGPLVTTTDIAGSAGYSSSDYVNNFNGTSSATPHAAGAGALLLSVQPSLTAAGVQQYMEESADDQVGTASEDTPGHDNYMGWGRVNLANMLALVSGGVTPPLSLTCVESGAAVNLSWTNGETYSSVTVARGGSTIANLAGSATSYTDNSPGVGNVSYTVVGTVDGNNSPTTSCTLFLTGGATDLVFAPPAAAGSTDGGQGLLAALNANGRSPLLVTSLDAVASLDAFEAVWVNLGMYPDNHPLTAAEGATLDTYLTNGSGGSFLYLEGGDTWAYDTATAVHARFGISGLSDGGADLSTITGVAGSGCDLAGNSWSYTGENSWVDHLAASGTGVVTLSNVAQSYDIGVFNDGGSYRTFGTAFEIGGVVVGSALVAGILECFTGGASPPSPPSASFTRSPSSGDAPLTVSFTDTSSGTVDSWSWTFGDGGTSSAQNPSHTYTSAGTYTVSLTVTNSGGSDTETCTGCVTVTTPTPAPNASFSATPDSGETPLSVSFTDTSSGAIDSWAWNFGDGGTSSAQNPSHTYTSAGTYTVTLTVTNSGGSDVATCADCIAVTDPPPPPPTAPFAAFTLTPSSGDAPLAVAFTDTSSGTIDSWAWTFGDGNTSTAQNPSHTYTSEGTYTVTLTVANSSGSDVATCVDCVTVSTAPPPPVVIACNGREAVAGVSISPTQSETRVVSGSVTSSSSVSHAFEVCESGTFLFSFCDAAATANYDTWLCVLDETGGFINSNDDSCNLLSEVSATLSPGNYHVVVSGYSTSEGDYTLAYSAGVGNCEEPPPPNIIACNGRDAVAGASISPTLSEVGVVSGSVTASSSASHAFEVCEPGTFYFSFCDPAATASYDPWLCVLDETGGVLASNDDTCGLLSEISVTLFAGSYHVVVSGYSTSAGDYTLAYSASVNNCQEPPPEPAPTADFMVSEIGGEAPVDVSFIDMSMGAIDSWAWDFGDGGTSSEQNPTHTYTTEGVYTVTLTVTGPGGSDTASCFDCIMVIAPPPPPSGDAKIYVSFKGTASIPGVGTVRDEDIVSYDPAVDEWAMFFDGSDVGLGGTDVDAFSIRADGSIVLSVNSGSFSLAGLVGGPSGTTIDDSDLIEFTPVSTGNTTAGSFTFLLDGSDIGLSTNGEDIDGVCWLEDGTILFSTQGTVRGNGPTGRDEDIMAFFPSALGSETVGTWEIFFDGSDVGYSGSSQGDVDGVALSEDQSLLLSTVGSVSTSSIVAADEDIILFSGTFGSSTSGSSTIAIILSSIGIDPSEDVDGISKP